MKRIKNNKKLERTMNKTTISLILGVVFLFVMISGVSALDSLGTYKQNNDVRITQVCSDATYINISSISYPNGTIAVSGIEMTSAGSGEYYYDFNQTSALGKYHVRGISDGCEETFATYFEVTLSGKDPASGNNFLPLGILALFFGISVVFLFMSFKTESAGIKIFFILTGFVFMMGSMASTHVMAFDNNLSEGVNATITTMMYAFGLILFVIFAYILINQIKESVNMMRINKGYEPDF